MKWGVSEKKCLHIKYSMFGKYMNECMSATALAYRICFARFCLFVIIFFPSEVSETRKKKDFIVKWASQIRLWCEVAMLKHMRVHIRTSRLVLKCSQKIKKIGRRSLLKRIIGIPFNAPLPCNRPHTGKDTTPAESQCCAPDVPTCCSKCDSPPPFLVLLTTYLPLVPTVHRILTGF